MNGKKGYKARYVRVYIYTSVCEYMFMSAYTKKKDRKDVVNLLMSATIQEENNRKLTDAEIRDQCNIFLLAGYETTANSLAMFVYCMATNNEAERKVLLEIDKGPINPTYDDLEVHYPWLSKCVQVVLLLLLLYYNIYQ